MMLKSIAKRHYVNVPSTLPICLRRFFSSLLPPSSSSLVARCPFAVGASEPVLLLARWCWDPCAPAQPPVTHRPMHRACSLAPKPDIWLSALCLRIRGWPQKMLRRLLELRKASSPQPQRNRETRRVSEGGGRRVAPGSVGLFAIFALQTEIPH